MTRHRRLPSVRPAAAAGALLALSLVPAADARTTWRMAPRAPAAATAAGVITAPARVFGGSTRPQQDPLVLTVRGTTVVRVSAQFDFATGCGSFAFDEPVRARIRNGRFTASVTGSATSSTGAQAAVLSTIKGALGPKKATGTAKLVIQPMPLPDGTVARACNSGTQRFTLKHDARHVFGGTTSQRMPVVVELSADRARVNHFHIGWQAACTNGGRFAMGDFLSRFPLVGGVFGDQWRFEYTREDGGMNHFTYSVDGRIARGRASGSIAVGIQANDATGASVATCSTGEVTWRASA